MNDNFDPMMVNTYATEQLANFIEAGVSKDTIYGCGLAWDRRPALDEELDKRQRNKLEDEETWNLAVQKDTIDEYKYYLRKYDKWSPEYRGKHVAEAKRRIEELETEFEGLRKELFKTMRCEPWKFKADGVKKLLNGIKSTEEIKALRELPIEQQDVTTRFLASGQHVTYDELKKEKIIPESIKKESLIAEDHHLVQTNITQLGDFPKDRRTDVYFFGVPRGGKSSVLAGILSSMYNKGIATYQPHYNDEGKDLASSYYYGLIESTKKGKFPVSTDTDSISFMNLDLEVNRRQNKLTFVEIGGEAFRAACESQARGDLAWGELGAGSCLQSRHRKLLIFILDYSLVEGINDQSTEFKQAQALETALRMFSTDGTGRDNSEGCTLSKVDTIAVLVTKSDLMKCSRDERTEKAYEYISGVKFATFMNNLQEKCRKFGINKPVGYQPYVMAFSLGKLHIGNTYQFDSSDSDAIVNFISDVTEGENVSIWGRLFSGN